MGGASGRSKKKGQLINKFLSVLKEHYSARKVETKVDKFAESITGKSKARNKWSMMKRLAPTGIVKKLKKEKQFKSIFCNDEIIMFRIEIRPINSKNRKLKLVLNHSDLETIMNGLEFLDMFYNERKHSEHALVSLPLLRRTNAN
jgi:hypothetical protein